MAGAFSGYEAKLVKVSRVNLVRSEVLPSGRKVPVVGTRNGLFGKCLHGRGRRWSVAILTLIYVEREGCWSGVVDGERLVVVLFWINCIVWLRITLD